MPRRRLVLPIAVSLLAAGLVVTLTGAPAGAAPTPITVPGGLRPGEVAAAGDCELGAVTCRPARSGSCTGNTSQTSPPVSIKVLVRTGTSTVEISSVPFQQYVEDVLPNEWIPSWDGDALKAGAIAVKSYAWYWATHFGGYVDGDPAQCFDVTDDTDFQKYVAGSGAQPDSARTTKVVQQTWPFVAREGGKVLETSYRADLSSPTEGCAAFADGTTMSQVGTQACNEASTANKYNVILGKYYFPGLQLATAQQRRTPYDFTFLQKSTPTAFHSGHWTLGDGYGTTFSFGTTGDLPTITDVGDGFARIGVFRPATGTWYLGNATGGSAAKVQWGAAGDVPVAAHYAGVSKPSVLGVFRPATGTWYRQGLPAVRFGTKGDIAVPGHYAGTTANDFTDRPAVFRPSTGQWYRQGLATVTYGKKGDIPLPADYDNNGTTDIAVYRPSNHTFYVRGGVTTTYGTTGDVPVTGDFNGDGKADLAVYRPSTHTWWIRGQAAVTLGASGDTPIGKAPYRG